MEGKESFVFYRSFYEAIEDLDDKEKIEVYTAICELSLNKKEIELKGIAKTIFKLIKPQIIANNERYENGKKGGRPKNNQRLLKNKTIGFVEKEPNENVNDNENDNGNENEELDIYKYIESNFGRLLSPIEYEEVQSWDDNELTKYAIKQAILNGKCNIKYISRILESYQKNSITTIQQAQASEENFKNQNNKQKVESVPDWFDKDIEPEYDEEKVKLMKEMFKGL